MVFGGRAPHIPKFDFRWRSFLRPALFILEMKICTTHWIVDYECRSASVYVVEEKLLLPLPEIKPSLSGSSLCSLTTLLPELSRLLCDRSVNVAILQGLVAAAVLCGT